MKLCSPHATVRPRSRRSGRDLAAVARAHGKSAAELAKALRTDHTLWVDPEGKLFLPRRRRLPFATEPVTAGAEPAGLEPLANTFLLHSKPGSKRVIFLDFDGYTMQNTAWNSGSVPNPLVCPPFDTDGNPGVFSDAERTTIQKAWQRVAEDYAPFDVDVTTEDPGDAAITRNSSTDEYYGTRVLISPISSYFGNYGGIAYVGVFDSTGDVYKPALVFPEKLGNNEKYIAEAAAHECGHNLGLSHDGDGKLAATTPDRGPARPGGRPIMGVGYYQNLTQWSKGEYNGANNTEDDLAVIGQNGCLQRTDDYPDSQRLGAASRIRHDAVAPAVVIENRRRGRHVDRRRARDPSRSRSSPRRSVPTSTSRSNCSDAGGALVASANPVDGLAASLSANGGRGDVLPLGYRHGQGRSAGDRIHELRITRRVDAGRNGHGPRDDVDAPPVATFTSSATRGTAPLSITFDGSASPTPTARS